MFEGKLIRLRPFEASDADAVFDTLNHPAMAGRRYVPWDFPDDRPLSRGQVDNLLHEYMTARKATTLAVTRLADDEPIGRATMNWGWDTHSPFVVAVIAPACQRQGFGSDALRLALRYLFTQTVAHVAQTWIDDWNESALAFARKLGFHHSGAMRRAGVRNGVFFDTLAFDLLRREWKQNADLSLP